jgi:small subunit ribosomal protein S2
MSNQQTSQVSLMSLFTVGAHRGNKKSKLNPRLKSRVFGYDKGLCLINLVETKSSLEKACELMTSLGKKRKQILVVGTSKHLQEATREFAKAFNIGVMPYVDTRWPGGTLTNYTTIKKTLKSIEKLKSMMENKEFFEKLPKNQQLEINKELVKKEKIFSGLVQLKNNKPGAVVILDSGENTIAIKEAQMMNVPVIALTNTSTVTLPENLDYTVLCNINSIKTIHLFIQELVGSYNAGAAMEIPAVVKEEQTIKS